MDGLMDKWMDHEWPDGSMDKGWMNELGMDGSRIVGWINELQMMDGWIRDG